MPMDVPFAQNMQYLPQNIQMQQRLLAEMAQAEFLTTMQGAGLPERDTRESREVQEMLRVEAMRKIMEAERMEEKRKRKLEKIRYMVRTRENPSIDLFRVTYTSIGIVEIQRPHDSVR